MQGLGEAMRRMGGWFRRGRLERAMREEIHFHLESRVEELRAEGYSAGAAKAQAQREFGGTTRILEDSREVWRFQWIEDLLSDLRHAARGFARSPGFVAVAVISLALGTGANTAIFSMASSFLFNRPSVRDAETLVRLRVGGSSHIELPMFRHLQDLRPFEEIAGVREETSLNWQSAGATKRISGFTVSPNYFEVLGVPLELGRGISSRDSDTTVVSHRFWRSELGGSPDILGRSIVLDAKPYTVVGVLPADHRTISGFGLSPSLYVAATKETDMLAIIARVAPGSSKEEVLGRLGGAAKELDSVFPQQFEKWQDNLRYYAVSGLDSFGAIGPATPLLMFAGLLGVVAALVLLIACANVSGLLLARSAARQQEVATRLSLGAPRNRIFRQWLAESLLLAAMGTVAGLAVNRLIVGIISGIEIPLPVSIRLFAEADDRLALYACAIAVCTALLVGVAPAIHAIRRGVLSGLKQGERLAGGRQHLRRVMVVGQLTVCTVLLAAGFLFVRNLQESSAMDVGFDTDNTVWASVRLLEERYPNNTTRSAFVSNALEQLRQIPGVESATVSSLVPLTDGENHRGAIRTSLSEEPVSPRYNFNRVGPAYFETYVIRILKGREFTEFDREGAPGVVILNDNMAKVLFGGADPIGHTLTFRDGRMVTVVGVAANSKYQTLGEEAGLAMYEPWLQSENQSRGTQFMVRCSGSRGEIVQQMRELFQTLDASAAVEVKSMTEALALALLPSRGGAFLLGGLGALGLLLASVGLAGMIAYSVQGRTKEIGLRMALGATQIRVFGLVVREAAWMAGIGLALGLGLAVFAAQPLAMFLVPGLAPTDPLAFGSVVLVLIAVTFAATLAPARRALGVEPLNALRYE